MHCQYVDMYVDCLGQEENGENGWRHMRVEVEEGLLHWRGYVKYLDRLVCKAR